MRIMLYLIGSLALALGFVGIFVPVMPTVPFLLIAAWAFARSSPRLRQKILENPTYGHHIRDWQERGAITLAAKIWAIGAMSFGVGLALWLGIPLWIVAAQSGICAAIAAFIATRPRA